MTERVPSSSVPVRASGEPQKLPDGPIGDLLAFGQGESTMALVRKDRDSYQFWQGWNAALDRASASPSDDGARQPQDVEDGDELHTGDDERLDLLTQIMGDAESALDDPDPALDMGEVVNGILSDAKKLDVLLLATIKRERAAASDDGAASPPQEPSVPVQPDTGTLDLEPIKARCDAATYGPWQRVYGGDDRYEVATMQAKAVVESAHICDAEFIAHARMDVPNLIREVEAFRSASLRETAPTAGDLLIAATDKWAQHAMKCDLEECEPCIVAINQLRLAYKVWQSSAHKSAKLSAIASSPAPKVCTCRHDSGMSTDCALHYPASPAPPETQK